MTGDNGTIERLVAHGGWAIDDAQARHAANPDTFWLPDEADLRRLIPGTAARLIFAVLDQADAVRDGLDPYDAAGRPNLVVTHERMWVWVDNFEHEGHLVGILQNLPTATHTRLVPGARMGFLPRHVIDLDLVPPVRMEDELAAMTEVGFPPLLLGQVTEPEDPGRPPTLPPSQAAMCARVGARPERPWAFSRCLLGNDVADGARPLYGGRFRPQPDRRDCGWAIWARHPDMEDAADDTGFQVVDVAEVHARSRDAWAYLALPPGWAYVLNPDGSDDVYTDPGLLDP